MSTSPIYHAFGLQGYDYVRQEFVAGNLILHIRPKHKLIRCPECNSGHVIRRGTSERWIKTVPIGLRPVWLVVPVPRVECRACGSLRRTTLGFADRRRWYTRAFERMALALCRCMTMLDVAKLLGVGWDTIKDIQKRYLGRRFAKPSLGRLRYIAIDEISVRKGHTYMTLVLDMLSGAVVFVGEGRNSAALEAFWKRLRRCGARVRAVAMDMSNAYVSATLANLPGVPIVFDRFHVVKLMNDKLTKVRRGLYRELSTPLGRQVLKGTRWILLKNPENLDQRRNERERLLEALRLNEPLAMAYYLKEDLRQIWRNPSKRSAARVLDDWIARAQASCVGPLMEMGRTLAAYRFGILAWFDHPISSGPLEGVNNRAFCF